jgi:hypothetical protein
MGSENALICMSWSRPGLLTGQMTVHQDNAGNEKGNRKVQRRRSIHAGTFVSVIFGEHAAGSPVTRSLQ